MLTRCWDGGGRGGEEIRIGAKMGRGTKRKGKLPKKAGTPLRLRMKEHDQES